MTPDQEIQDRLIKTAKRFVDTLPDFIWDWKKTTMEQMNLASLLRTWVRKLDAADPEKRAERLEGMWTN